MLPLDPALQALWSMSPEDLDRIRRRSEAQELMERSVNPLPRPPVNFYNQLGFPPVREVPVKGLRVPKKQIDAQGPRRPSSFATWKPSDEEVDALLRLIEAGRQAEEQMGR